MRILFSSCSAPHYMAPPVLADEQINCGPFFPDRHIDGRIVSLSTARGDYDLGGVAARLPADQQPDAVVCMLDASWFNIPRNLAAFKGPKIALIADTHHMSKPILGMLNYLKNEKFDRIIFLYTRHHLEFFRRAGHENLFWLPGLTFPHTDALVHASRHPERINRIALIGQSGSLHQRRLTLAGTLAAHKLPLVFREATQRESLQFYGTSSIGFNVTANSDLNLRAIETTAAGSMLLMDRLAPAAGLDSLWQDGREYVGYADADEMLERARHFIAHPAEARAIGDAGARWFDRHLNFNRRRQLFERIVWDGRADPMFAVPPPTNATSLSFGGDGARVAAALAVYEHLQKLHSQQETVRVQIDDSVPTDFTHVCTTLPRLLVSRQFPGSETPDCFVTSAARATALKSLEAPRLWCWDATPPQLPQLAARFKSAGLASLRDDVAFFGLPGTEAGKPIDKRAAEARQLLDTCDYNAAINAARRALQANPKSVEALLVMAEVALENGKPDLFTKMIAEAQAASPGDPRVALLELSTRIEGGRQRPTDRLLGNATRHLGRNELWTARTAAERVLRLDPQHAAAWYWLGQAKLRLLETTTELTRWREHGSALNALRKAVALAPQRAAYWLELGGALRRAGLLSEALTAFAQGVELDPTSAPGWFDYGEALLKQDAPEKAAEAFTRGLAYAPTDHNLLRWLGHAHKRLGRLVEAQACYLRAYGADPAAALPSTSSSRAGKKRRALFIVQHGPSWSCNESVYQAFLADPAWDAVVVAVPYVHPFYNEAQNDTDAIFDFLRTRAIPFTRGDQFRLSPTCADVVFLQNPYDVTRPPDWRVPHLLSLGLRLAYVPYGLEIGGGERNNTMVMNMSLQQLAWLVFARSERQRRAYAQHCLTGNAHVVVTGHPKLDALATLDQADTTELRAFARGRRLIAWNPHFDIRLDGSRFGDGFSTFLGWWEFLLEEFARRPDLALVVRPHPLFFGTLEDRGILTRDQIKAYFDRGIAAGILFVDRNPSPLPLFAAADAMMSDISSFVLEFSATGKPLLFLRNPHGPQLNSDAEFVHRHLYQAEHIPELTAFLDLIARGEDPLGPDRNRAIGEYLHRPAQGSGLAIKQAIDARLATELAATLPPEPALLAS